MLARVTSVCKSHECLQQPSMHAPITVGQLPNGLQTSSPTQQRSQVRVQAHGRAHSHREVACGEHGGLGGLGAVGNIWRSCPDMPAHQCSVFCSPLLSTLHEALSPMMPISTWEMTQAAAVAAIRLARRSVMHDWGGAARGMEMGSG